MVSRTFKLTIAFDGTDFCGWQVQPDAITVHATLTAAFKRAFEQDAIINGPSRTDAGVHALGYVAALKTTLPLPASTIRDAWNGKLPESIIIRSLEPVADDFNPRQNIFFKEYHYHFFINRPLPFIARFGWYSGHMHKIDLAKLDQTVRLFEGEHNFRAFCRIDPGEQVKVIRRVDYVRAFYSNQWNAIRVVVKAPGFLRYQIRRMIGAAYAIMQRPSESPALITEALATGKITAPWLTLCLPAKGLCLRRVVYAATATEEPDGVE